MLIIPILLATSITVATVSAVPTDYFSPGTISNLVVWYILRDGMSNFDYASFDGELIDYSLLYSYGSPDIRYTTFWWVDISGDPDSYLHNDVSYSYGHLTR